MARIARFVVPGLPHHVTQRGNRRERVFFGDDDYELYRDLLASQCRKHGVACWAYCLMPNHVHLILTPQTRGASRGRSAMRTGAIRPSSTRGCGSPAISSTRAFPRS